MTTCIEQMSLSRPVGGRHDNGFVYRSFGYISADQMVLTQLRDLLWCLDGLARSVFLFAAVDCAARTFLGEPG